MSSSPQSYTLCFTQLCAFKYFLFTPTSLTVHVPNRCFQSSHNIQCLLCPKFIQTYFQLFEFVPVSGLTFHCVRSIFVLISFKLSLHVSYSKTLPTIWKQNSICCWIKHFQHVSQICIKGLFGPSWVRKQCQLLMSKVSRWAYLNSQNIFTHYNENRSLPLYLWSYKMINVRGEIHIFFYSSLGLDY